MRFLMAFLVAASMLIVDDVRWAKRLMRRHLDEKRQPIPIISNNGTRGTGPLN